MKARVIRISELSEKQSVVCIIGDDKVPGWINLNEQERGYAGNLLNAGEDTVQINGYNRFIYLVRVKSNSNLYKTREEVRRMAYNLRKSLKAGQHTDLVISEHNTYRGASVDFAEGLLLSMYSFDKYKTTKDDDRKQSYPSALLLRCEVSDEDLLWLEHLTDAVYFTRDLINEPVNHLNATTLSGEIRKIGEAAGFTVEVLTKGRIEALKMGGLLAVNKGSVDPPVFSILEWKPAGCVNSKPVVLVGKGIVYDTGGLNLKSGEHMAGMHGDMAGAAIVTGVMHTVARCRIPLHIIGLIPSTDNRPGGNAYTQGDIIRMYNGMTVEIGNTDAEGRLILADAISYASKYTPELIIDIATLTGSAAMTFGNQAIAMMTNADRKYADLLKQSGEDVYERIGELPFWDEYAELIKSDVADIRNVGGREAGAITAGKFLEKFASYPLIHLDIAGTEMLKKDDFYRLKGSPGSGLRLLATFLKKFAAGYIKRN
jgi:leucyl aminopeptidase